jgi:hypothetical protein
MGAWHSGDRRDRRAALGQVSRSVSVTCAVSDRSGKEQHYLHAASRARYGITDGPAYRDLQDSGAALFHISVQDMDTAMGWFRSDTFKEATKLAKVTGRRFYLAHPQT